MLKTDGTWRSSSQLETLCMVHGKLQHTLAKIRTYRDCLSTCAPCGHHVIIRIFHNDKVNSMHSATCGNNKLCDLSFFETCQEPLKKLKLFMCGSCQLDLGFLTSFLILKPRYLKDEFVFNISVRTNFNHVVELVLDSVIRVEAGDLPNW